MSGLSLREAAREAGRSKSAILRAIQAGRLSATRLDDGGWSIDPAELFRVYEPAPPVHRPEADDGGQGAMALALAEQRIADLQTRLAEMKEARDDARRERDSWRDTAQSAVSRPLMLPAPETPQRRGFWLWRRAG